MVTEVSYKAEVVKTIVVSATIVHILEKLFLNAENVIFGFALRVPEKACI